jgi:hypothetical protein
LVLELFLLYFCGADFRQQGKGNREKVTDNRRKGNRVFEYGT